MIFFKWCAATVVLLFYISAKSQKSSFPQNYFSSPVEVPLLLSGNFGELRSNHFHSGIDIKTQGIEGLKVLAVADGFVSRIKVSPWGYGNVIYVTHPNGYTSVYAHLQKFNSKIEAYVKKSQYINETWEIELFPKDSSLTVLKGDLIAYSGNTGSSAAPHLHFEIRETQTEYAINPLLFGYNVKDEIAPSISKIAIYPLNEESFINGKNSKLLVDVVFLNGGYTLKNTIPIQVYGKIGIAISTFDKANDAYNQNGTYFIEVSTNNKETYSHTLDKVSFNETRAINSHIDYNHYIDKNQHLQKCYIEECNPLSIYTYYSNKGAIEVTSNSIIKIKCIAKDINNNASVLNFELTGNTDYKGKIEEKISAKPTRYLKCNEPHTFIQEDIIVSFPANALYNDLKFEYKKIDNLWGAIGSAHAIHNDYTPIHSPINISIKNTTLSPLLKSKATILRLDSKEKWQSIGGIWHDEYISASSKFFGTFYIRIDTVAPVIEAVNIKQEKNLSAAKNIQFIVRDNLTGVKNYKGYIDNRWILIEYQPKTSRLVYYFDDKITRGKHYFTLEVEDSVGNCNFYQAWFYR